MDSSYQFMRKGHHWGKKEMDDKGEISILQTIIASWSTGRLTNVMPTLMPIVATYIVASGLTEDAQTSTLPLISITK